MSVCICVCVCVCEIRTKIHIAGPFTVIEDSMMLGRACRYLPLDPSKVRTGTAVQRLRHKDTRMRARTDLFWKHIQVYLCVSQVFAAVEGSTPEERWDKCIEQVCMCVRACVRACCAYARA
jgi:hypothetical protein